LREKFHQVCSESLEDQDQELEPSSHLKFSFYHLVLRQHVFTFLELDNLHNLEFKLRFLESSLMRHFTLKQARSLNHNPLRKSKPLQTGTCKTCVTREVLCFECNEAQNRGKFDTSQLLQCKGCHKFFHKIHRPRYADKAKQVALEKEKPYMAKSCL